jgi:starch-binding outer membrane protein, SusD/RagB family
LDYDKGRLTRYGINALQADVYLWNFDYQKCIDACNKIIYSGLYGLVQTPDSSGSNNNWYTDNFVNGNSNESIFEFQFNATKTNPFYDYFSNAGKWSFIASTYVVSDGSLFISENGYMPDLRAKPSSSFTASQMVWKYTGLSTNGSTKRAKDVFNAHWIVYRLADIYLMRAEALNQIDRGQEAIADVKTIQARSYADTTYQIDNTDKDGITDLILKERQKELLFEGKRWFDVLRHARRNHFSNMRYIHEMIGNYASVTLQNELINRYSDTLSLYFPIPQSEIDANPNLKQNKYYDPSGQ